MPDSGTRRDDVRRVLLVRFEAIGNALVAVPAIRAIREAWPEALLCMAADPLTIELLQHCPHIDEFVRYDRKGPERAGPGYVRFILELRKRRFTHSVHFKRHIRSELIGFLAGARVRAGFVTDERVQLINRRAEYEEGANIVEQNLKLARLLGAPAADRRLEYWTPPDTAAVDDIVARAEGEPILALHPGGSTQRERLWPYYGELAARMRDRLGLRPVFLGAPSERAIVEEAAEAAGPSSITAVGLSLPEAGELIRRAALFAGTDSGPAHLADAAGTPGAILYAPHKGLAGQLAKWKPEGEGYLAFLPPRDCGECGEHPCPPERQGRCAADIAMEEVAAGLERLYADTLKKRDGGGPRRSAVYERG